VSVHEERDAQAIQQLRLGHRDLFDQVDLRAHRRAGYVNSDADEVAGAARQPTLPEEVTLADRSLPADAGAVDATLT
jgi:hypothetical protein